MKKLEEYNKTNPFKVPENYFDNFNIEIMDMLSQKEKIKKTLFWKKALPWAGIAAIFCGVILSTGILRTPQARKVDKEIAGRILYEEDYLNYFEEQSAKSFYNNMFYENDY